jgi:hypothetical protein
MILKPNQRKMENEKQVTIAIEKTPAFTETWYEGYVEYDGKKHQFWMIDPEGGDYEVECRWFFKNVPREVRMMYNNIIEAYKSIKNDRRKNKDGSSVQSY